MKIPILVLSLCVLAASAAQAVPSGCQEELAVTSLDDRPAAAKSEEELRHAALCAQIAEEEGLKDLAARLAQVEEKTRGFPAIGLVSGMMGTRFALAIIGIEKANLELIAASLAATSRPANPRGSSAAAARIASLRVYLDGRVRAVSALIEEAERDAKYVPAKRS